MFRLFNRRMLFSNIGHLFFGGKVEYFDANNDNFSERLISKYMKNYEIK